MKGYNILIVIFSTAIFSCTNSKIANSQLLDCWIKSYDSTFNFIGQLDKLEKDLIDKGIVAGSSKKDYENLLTSINSGELDKKIKILTVEQYVNPEPFKICATSNEIPYKDDKTIRYGFLFSIYVVLAESLATIDVEVDKDSQIIIDNKYVDREEFKIQIKSRMKEIEENGIPKEDIIVSLKVAKNVKMGLVSDIQLQLRDLKARKILYRD